MPWGHMGRRGIAPRILVRVMFRIVTIPVSPLGMIQAVLHFHSSIYPRRYTIFSIDSAVNRTPPPPTQFLSWGLGGQR
jgi:hypothetical protein